MDYTFIWEDCIDKLEDLGYEIDKLSVLEFSKLCLIDDPLVSPIILHVMEDIQSLEIVLSNEKSMNVELSVSDYVNFAYQRGFLRSGEDNTLNSLLAISFIIDELQTDRILFYRRNHYKSDFISPNTNMDALRQRTFDLGSIVIDKPDESTIIDTVMKFCYTVNPLLLDKSQYSTQEIDKLSTFNDFCKSLYYNKKTMMIQRLDVTIQSLLWNQTKDHDLSEVEELRNSINITHSYNSEDIFSARRSLLNRVFKVSTSNSHSKGKFRNIRIGFVPDRGGRVTEIDNEHDRKSVTAYRSTSKRQLSPIVYSTSEKSGKVEDASESVMAPDTTTACSSCCAVKPEFNETEKVVSVFGSGMDSDNKFVSSNCTRQICWAFQKGECRFGNRCKYSHIK